MVGKKEFKSPNWMEIRNWFSFLFAGFGATLVLNRLFGPLEIWTHADWIQFAIAVGTIVIGGAAVWVAFRQNNILQAQNALIHQQNDYLKNQKELNDLLIQQEQSREIDRVKTWCKNALKTADTPGVLQSLGSGLRQRFPGRISTIIEAVEELRNEDPSSKMPSTYDFLKLMNSNEPQKWPDPSPYFNRSRI